MDRRVTCLEFGLVSVDHGIDPPRPCAQSCRLFRPPSACISMKKWSLDTKNFERLRGSWENTRVSLCEGSSTLNEVPSKPEAQISIELLQRRSEHNDGRLDTLEEIALHQQNLVSINEVLARHCKQLQILYLHKNLIRSVENLASLRRLKYINLSLNKIVEVKGFEGCKCLEKLDLTCNCIHSEAIFTVSSLKHNIMLRDLHLVGNPCTKHPMYRAFVFACVPQLQSLDGRLVHRNRCQPFSWSEGQARLHDNLLQVESLKNFSSDTTTLEVCCCGNSNKPQGDVQTTKNSCNFQDNKGKWNFRLSESQDKSMILLEVHFSKSIATSDICVDIQRSHVKCTVRGKSLNVKLLEEVLVEESTATRSSASGKLLLSMPKYVQQPRLKGPMCQQ